MIIALDNSVRVIEMHRQNYPDIEFIQFRTPLTRYRQSSDVQYILDNGAYSGFDEGTWCRMANESIQHAHCIGIVLPDEVGDWVTTKWLFQCYKELIPKEKRWIVLQDGCTLKGMPWEEISGVFVGGTNSFKYSRELFSILEEAKARDLWIHVGRVNTPPRIIYFEDIADSFDGSGIARFSGQLDDAIQTLRHLRSTRQAKLGDFT